MSSRQCPLCGKPIEDDSNERFCSDCRKLNEQYEAFLDPTNSSLEQDKASLPQDDDSKASESQRDSTSQIVDNSKRKKKNRILLVVFCVLILLGVTVGCYLFIQFKHQQEIEELNFWNNALRTNTNKAYLEYMERYPEGQYFTEAQNNILQFNEKVKKLWNNIKKDGSESEVLTFLSVYKETPYYREASDLLDSLAWVNVQKQNTQDAYKNYLDRVAQKELIGYYKPLAEEKYDYLSQMEFVGGDEWKSVEKIISRYFQDLSSKSYADLSVLFSERVKVFYKMEDVNSQEIVTSIKNQMKKDDIASVLILPDTEGMRVQKDKNGNYIIDLSVKENINYNKTKEKKEHDCRLFFVLDTKMKIVELKGN